MAKGNGHVSRRLLMADFLALQNAKVRYGFGAKAKLGAAPSTIHEIDCSGYVRWALDRASKGGVPLPDGSQNQRVYAEKNWRQVNYADAAHYANPQRLFIAFIRPFYNECLDVGHVWLMTGFLDHLAHQKTLTLESHGGKGIDSRNWDSPTLRHQVYSCFEIPFC